jgi:transcriptional regulator with XRE-family HTH domain
MPENIDDFYKAVGSLIQKNRTEKKLTQEKLAEKVSLTRTSITNIEKGRQKLLLHTLFDIAYYLGISIEDLIPKAKLKDNNIYENVPNNAAKWIQDSTSEINSIFNQKNN